MDDIELAPLFQNISGCKDVVRLCSTSTHVRDWCESNVRVFVQNMSRHRAFAPFFKDVRTMADYRRACQKTINTIKLRNMLQQILIDVNTVRTQMRIKVLLVAIEYDCTTQRNRIEVDNIDPYVQSLLIKSTSRSNIVKLNPAAHASPSVTATKSRSQNMNAAARIWQIATDQHGVDLSKLNVDKVNDRIVRIARANASEDYVAIRVSARNNGDHFGIAVESEDVHDLWTT